MILFAPLQGITDYKFRTAFSKYFGGIDAFYTPYIRLKNEKQIKNNQLKDILPQNNKEINIIPQTMVNNSSDFLFLDKLLSDYGYKEINWNLGCPYPMVTNRNLGAGLLQNPELIQQILDEIKNKLSCKVSIKMRLGNKDENEIDKLIPILNNFDLSCIIIHPRIAKQLYKGDLYLKKFKEIIELLNHKIIYNGNITNLESFEKTKKIFPKIDDFMLGRGLVSNPFLAEEINEKKSFSTDEKYDIFKQFHDALFLDVEKSLSGKSHILPKMTNYWVYFSLFFTDNKKVFKIIKKTRTIEDYKHNVMKIFSDF